MKILKNSVTEISNGISYAKNELNKLVALRTINGETKCIGYISNLQQFVDETNKGIGEAFIDSKFKTGWDIEYITE